MKIFFRIAMVLIPLIFFGAWLDPYEDAVSEGNSLFHDKKFKEARAAYDRAEDHVPSEEERTKLAYNKGNADYMMENYDSAVLNFKKALGSEDQAIQAKAFFNLANVYVKQKNYKEAVNAYMNALKLDPNHEGGKKNLEYILKKQKEQEQKDGDKKNNKGDSKDQKKNDQNKSSDKKNEQKRQIDQLTWEKKPSCH